MAGLPGCGKLMPDWSACQLAQQASAVCEAPWWAWCSSMLPEHVAACSSAVVGARYVGAWQVGVVAQCCEQLVEV